ncbi:MAG: isoleucine--tRNA ligase, partial [Pseudobutyrivibrio sp.]|nr:isoleucine--tRNA ligase [Pseudobutyrivibrio sp.]
DDVSAFTSYSFKPQLRTVGPKYGKFLGGIQKALASLDGNAAYAELKANGVLKLPEVDASIELAEEDLLISMAQTEGFVADGDNYVTVVLDTNLSEELLEEGFVREIVSKIQTMRKEADFEVMDRISVAYSGSEKAAAIFAKNKDVIAGEVLADSIEEGTAGDHVKEWNINGEKVTLAVTRRG